uniref:Programmed cell death 2-like n=1 Tax=Fundulus heteroclitus TaxID=8078 RepID=A0A3Q2T1K8_FUNHE
MKVNPGGVLEDGRCESDNLEAGPGGSGSPADISEGGPGVSDSSADVDGSQLQDAEGRARSPATVDGAETLEAVCQMDVSSGLQQLSLVESKDIPVFRPFFISVLEESELSGEDDELGHAQELLREYEQREGVALGVPEESDGSGEMYEKTSARHADAVFSRFMKTISVCPQQIIRYCRHRKPLFISKMPSNNSHVVSVCSSCGEPRTFELQLMPALVYLLQRIDSNLAKKLEFGTVLVYTCTNSCWTAGSKFPVEEFCFVQPDPDHELFK